MPSYDGEITKGFTCECGAYHRFDMYVLAHWNTKLGHECACGRKHTIVRGIALLQESKRGRSKGKKK